MMLWNSEAVGDSRKQRDLPKVGPVTIYPTERQNRERETTCHVLKTEKLHWGFVVKVRWFVGALKEIYSAIEGDP